MEGEIKLRDADPYLYVSCLCTRCNRIEIYFRFAIFVLSHPRDQNLLEKKIFVLEYFLFILLIVARTPHYNDALC